MGQNSKILVGNYQQTIPGDDLFFLADLGIHGFFFPLVPAVKPSILFPRCGQSKRRAPKFTREFPKAKFSSRQVAKRKATTYFARIAKRLRA